MKLSVGLGLGPGYEERILVLERHFSEGRGVDKNVGRLGEWIKKGDIEMVCSVGWGSGEAGLGERGAGEHFKGLGKATPSDGGTGATEGGIGRAMAVELARQGELDLEDRRRLDTRWGSADGLERFELRARFRFQAENGTASWSDGLFIYSK